MTPICYLSSFVISFATLVMTIHRLFADADSRFAYFVGDTEICFLVGVAVALLIIGFRLDEREVE